MIGTALLTLALAASTPPAAKAAPEEADAPVELDLLAPDPVRAARRLVFEVPHPLAVADVPGELIALDLPVRLRAVRSKDSFPVLYEYFLKEFEKAELFVPDEEELSTLEGMPTLTGFDPDSRIAYTIIFQLHADGTTTAILGEAHVGAQRAPMASEDFAPLFPGATSVVRSDLEVSRALFYAAPAPVREVTAFYRKMMAIHGYQEPQPLVFVRSSKKVVAQIKPNGKGSRVILFEQLVGGDEGDVEALGPAPAEATR